MRNQVFKKLFSVLLALIMVAGLLPASAMAGGWGAMDVDTTPELKIGRASCRERV